MCECKHEDLVCEICGKNGAENQHDLWGEILCWDCACLVRERLPEAVREIVASLKSEQRIKEWAEDMSAKFESLIEMIRKDFKPEES